MYIAVVNASGNLKFFSTFSGNDVITIFLSVHCTVYIIDFKVYYQEDAGTVTVLRNTLI